MNRSGTLRVAWGLMLGTFVVGAVVSVLAVGGLQNPEMLVPISAFAVMGAVIAAHRPRNPVGWIFLGVGALTGLLGLGAVAAAAALGRPGPPPWWGVAGAWIGSWVWFPMLALMTLFTLLLYPSGLPSPRWRPVLWLALGATTAVSVMAATRPWLCLSEGGTTCPADALVHNPLSPPFMAGVNDVESTPLFNLFGLLLIVGVVASLVSAVVRTRRSTGIERLQMRWFAFAAALLVVELVMEALVPRFGDSAVSTVGSALALTAVPLSCGVAIMRYRLYDIDRLISRTVAYVLVTGLLLTVYAAVVTSVTRVLPQSSSAFAVAAATLSAAALVRPLLSRVQRLVDQRFNRSRYDAVRTLEAFAAGLRDETDENAILHRLDGALEETLQPAVTTVWLRGTSS